MSTSPRPDAWIGRVYGAKNKTELAGLYDRWAETYDADMLAVGYLHPAVIAGLAGRYIPDKNAMILDAGSGTGLIGQVLSILGYRNLHGIDISDGMIARASALGAYRELRKRVLGEPLDYPDSSIDAIVSTGTFTQGHAPASAWDELARVLKPGGIAISTFGTKVWEQSFSAKLGPLLQEVETTPVYRPMPYSATEAHFTTRAHVFRKR